MARALVQASGLEYAIGGKRIIDSVDLSVDGGELVGVIGPNGSGKTTLLRLLSGVLTPTAGAIHLSGRALVDLRHRERARLVAFMSQEAAQGFPFTVMEILLMGRYPHLGRFERESSADRELACRILSYVGLSGFEERLSSGLSGGERQLMLFARALVQEASLLLLDEPSSSLDIRHQDRIFSMAQELAREGRAVMTVVHNLDIAAHYCSRLVLLDAGRIAASGRAEEVLTGETLERVYRVKTLISPSAATGSITVTVIPPRAEGGGVRVHLIGGAGSAVNLTRELFRLGHSLTGGITHEFDSDEKLWRSLGVQCASVGAFSRISEEDVERASRLVESADLTILCSFPVGPGNIGNMTLARRAHRLVVLKSSREDLSRSFFTAEGRELYDALCLGAESMSYDEVLDFLRREFSPAGDRT